MLFKLVLNFSVVVLSIFDSCLGDDVLSSQNRSNDGLVVKSISEIRQTLLVKLTSDANKQPNMNLIPINVYLRLIPIKIQDLSEKNEVLETTIRIQLTWKDPRLSWDPLEFYDVNEIIVPGNSIWSPDIGILNSVSDIYHVIRDTRFEMKVESSGRVWWHPTGIVKTYCKLKLRYFPFDKQNCTLVMESPTQDSRFMNLTLRPRKLPVDTRMYIAGETWNLLSVGGYNTVKYLGSRSIFTGVLFYIHIERSRIYHVLNVILPAIFLSMVQLLFFFLPNNHVQRVGSTTTTLLSVVVFHTVVVSQLPKTSTDVPLLATYIFLVTIVSGISVCTSILMARFVVLGQSGTRVPGCLRKIPHPCYCIKWLFCIKRSRARDDDTASNISTEAMPMTESKKRSNINYNVEYWFNSWNDVAKVIDMTLLSIAVVTAVSAPLIMFIIIPAYVDM